jgi:hypothetical protein
MKPIACSGYSQLSADGLVCRVEGHAGNLPCTYHAESETVWCHIPDDMDSKSVKCAVYSLKDPLLPPCCTSDDDSAEPEAMGGVVRLELSNEQADSREAQRNQADQKSPAEKTALSGLMPFIIISVSYLLFTTTDGAIRMIVLLQVRSFV